MIWKNLSAEMKWVDEVFFTNSYPWPFYASAISGTVTGVVSFVKESIVEVVNAVAFVPKIALIANSAPVVEEVGSAVNIWLVVGADSPFAHEADPVSGLSEEGWV